MAWGAVFVASLAALVKGADLFLHGAEKIGRRLKLSPFLMGVVLVGFGTSFPELVSALEAVWLDVSEIAIGTAVGSNITNILLILGLAATLGGGIKVSHELVRVDLPFLFASALILLPFAVDGEIDRIEGAMCLGVLAIYLSYAISPRHTPSAPVAALAKVVPPEAAEITARIGFGMAVGLALLHIGARYTIESVTQLSELVNLGPEILATVLVALGTSLPELTVSVRAAQGGNPEMAVGNVIGSNVFNAVGVVGAAALLGPIVVPDSILYFALPAMLGTTLLAFFALMEREATRWDGWLLLLLYVAFLTQLLRMG